MWVSSCGIGPAAQATRWYWPSSTRLSAASRVPRCRVTIDGPRQQVRLGARGRERSNRWQYEAVRGAVARVRHERHPE